jgi:hypothetical protein
MTDPLVRILGEHIWYTTTTGTKGPIIMCLCRARLRDTDEHAEHLASIVRRHMGIPWSGS